jgi:RHS repeat-associated protein
MASAAETVQPHPSSQRKYSSSDHTQAGLNQSKEILRNGRHWLAGPFPKLRPSSVRAEFGREMSAFTMELRELTIQLSQQVLNPDSGSLESIAPNNAHLITDNSYLYCGEQYDRDLGLYYLRARHMNPETGRFHTLDTYEGRLGEPLSLHKYMYAHANPVMGIDPSGMFFSTVYFAAVQATQQILEAAKQVRAQFAISVATGGRMLHQLGYACYRPN